MKKQSLKMNQRRKVLGATLALKGLLYKLQNYMFVGPQLQNR